MKKIGCVLFILLFLTTGCSKEKSLSCSLNDGYGVMTFISTFDVDKNGSVYKKGTFQYNIDLSGYSNYNKEALENQDFCSVFQSSYKDGFSNCVSTLTDTGLSLTADLDVYKSLYSMGEFDILIYKNMEDTKGYFENAGFTCSEQ